MKTIKQLAEEAALVMVFEDTNASKIEIKISAQSESHNWNNEYIISIPIAFLQEYTKLAIENYNTYVS